MAHVHRTSVDGIVSSEHRWCTCKARSVDRAGAPQAREMLSEIFVLTHAVDTHEQAAQPAMSEAFKTNNTPEDLLYNKEDQIAIHQVECFEDCPRPLIRVGARIGSQVQEEWTVLLDSGADVDLISEKVARQFQEQWQSLSAIGQGPWSLVTANGSKAKIENAIQLRLIIQGKEVEVLLHIVKGLPATDVVLGNPSLAKLKTTIDWKTGTFSMETPEGHVEAQWHKNRAQHWRHPIVLKTDSDYRLKAGHSVLIGLQEIPETEWIGVSVREGLIRATDATISRSIWARPNSSNTTRL
jgi:hypothetical protein